MKSEMETLDQVQAQASWRVAVTQGLTLLGFRDWVIECTHYPREVCEKRADDAVARAGNDGFVVVLTSNESNHEAAKSIASSIISDSESPIPQPDIGRVLSGSVGIALFPNHAANTDSRLISVDRHRYEARRQGKGTISFVPG